MAFNFSSLRGNNGKSGLLVDLRHHGFFAGKRVFCRPWHDLAVASQFLLGAGGRQAGCYRSLRAAFEASSSAIKTELDAKRDATLARVKASFAAQNQAKGKALIKTLLPLVENYDFDTAETIWWTPSIPIAPWQGFVIACKWATGPTQSAIPRRDELVSFKVVEKNSFADVELELLATPAVLAQAEEEEKVPSLR